MKLTDIKNHFWFLGLLVGLSVSSVVTLIIVLWERLENPNGIFYNDGGTNWQFIFDTAISWFVPIFVYVSLVVTVIHLLFSAIKWLLKRQT
ncbi:hypothetical protein CXF83_02740 [Shewanella sp. Choline-02u-19]|nr:hypothetical protein CXF86_20710 [Shewanella sp. GutCb]PKH57299.1 hypothetical protein CXF84_10015 [Shewanella sp. Bg11-22]PKI29587.1 hypothetical protein CXF83_02740 [Shewanella sp. Choline-02u-19]